MPASFSPPRTTATPPSTGSLPTLSLEAEQQLGFPAGAAAGASSLDTAGPTVPCIPNPEAEAAASGSSEDKDGQDGKKKKNRCAVCKKKLGLTGFTCRCGGLFCSIHRYSDKHECNFDYKAMGEKEISEANPVIVAAKVAKI